MPNLSVGDVVVLSSGGPWMTIEKLLNADEVSCVWFDESYLQRDTFQTSTLIKKDE